MHRLCSHRAEGTAPLRFLAKVLKQETREKIGRANRGKTLSTEIREKMSRAKLGKARSPDKEPARELFLSLPFEMSLREKRRLLEKKFPHQRKSTRNRWVRQWEDEKT